MSIQLSSKQSIADVRIAQLDRRGGEYCNQFLCLCLSIREHISGTAGEIFTNFFAWIPCGHSSVILWRRYDTLCTSGAESDVYECFFQMKRIYKVKIKLQITNLYYKGQLLVSNPACIVEFYRPSVMSVV